jgi:hypothetical protein
VIHSLTKSTSKAQVQECASLMEQTLKKLRIRCHSREQAPRRIGLGPGLAAPSHEYLMIIRRDKRRMGGQVEE